MALKKSEFSEDEIAIFDGALIYKRGEHWHMRMWLNKEHKYARFALKTTNRAAAEDRAKQHYYELMAQQLRGHAYFSITTKAGVEMYLEFKKKEIGNNIVEGRYATIRTHLTHWLDFIKRDTKLKELEITDCSGYFQTRTKTKKSLQISQVTVVNEQATINAMMMWLYKRKHTDIQGFEFDKLKRLDRGAEENRRAIFSDAEVGSITSALKKYIAEAEKDLSQPNNLTKAICGYYLGFSLVSGLRRGEQMQLRWKDTEELENEHTKVFDLIVVKVRSETSKVRKFRKFVVKDAGYLNGAMKHARRRHGGNVSEKGFAKIGGEELIFSVDGERPLTPRVIGLHFDKLMVLAKIQGIGSRDLVPYCFRHYFITQRVNSNLPPVTVAEMCGTSITQIEKTYYHTTDEKMLSNALAGYYVKNGMLIPK